jgi:hypothetical protein
LGFAPRAVNRLARYLRQCDQSESPDEWKVCGDFLGPWAGLNRVFNNDSTFTSAVLDRLLHHAETVVIEGKTYRMKDQIETP